MLRYAVPEKTNELNLFCQDFPLPFHRDYRNATRWLVGDEKRYQRDPFSR